MKKNTITAASLLLCAVALVGIKVYSNTTAVYNNLLLQNVEALAQDEVTVKCNGTSGTCYTVTVVNMQGETTSTYTVAGTRW